MGFAKLGVLCGEEKLEPAVARISPDSRAESYPVDLGEVQGQKHVKRALEIAAAGSHNIVMVGPPGTGKSMLAKRMPTILPEMTEREAMETTRIHSIAGHLAAGSGLLRSRPFRSPHHLSLIHI